MNSLGPIEGLIGFDSMGNMCGGVSSLPFRTWAADKRLDFVESISAMLDVPSWRIIL